MANTLLTPLIIAREAIMTLLNNLVFANLVHRDFNDEFAQVGDTVNVRKPATFTAQEYNGSSITIQDAGEGTVPVKLDKIIDVSFAVTSKDMTLNVKDFSSQFIQPAMQAHAQKIDEMIAGLYVDVPYNCEVGSTPKVDDIAAITEIMNTNKVPLLGRNLVLGPTSHSKYIVLDAFLHADKTGSTLALRDASMGRVMGLDSYMDQNVKTHTKGDLDANAALTANSGATSGTIASGGNAKKIKKGDLFTIADTAGKYVCTEELATAADGTGTLKFYPAVPSAVAGKVITVVATHVSNLAFHRNAFALVTRPLAAPQGAAKSETISFNGITCRVVYDYDMDKKSDIVSIDFLCGVKTLTPELAVRFNKK